MRTVHTIQFRRHTTRKIQNKNKTKKTHKQKQNKNRTDTFCTSYAIGCMVSDILFFASRLSEEMGIGALCVGTLFFKTLPNYL